MQGKFHLPDLWQKKYYNTSDLKKIFLFIFLEELGKVHWRPNSKSGTDPCYDSATNTIWLSCWYDDWHFWHQTQSLWRQTEWSLRGFLTLSVMKRFGNVWISVVIAYWYIFYLLLCNTQSGLFEDNLANSAFECQYEQLSSSLWPIFFLLKGLSWWNLFVCARWKRTVECSWWISLFEALLLLLDIEQHKADRVEKEYFDVTKQKMFFFLLQKLGW